eukprot:371718-Pyramimonas_sp.AAC.1
MCIRDRAVGAAAPDNMRRARAPRAHPTTRRGHAPIGKTRNEKTTTYGKEAVQFRLRACFAFAAFIGDVPAREK